MQGLEVLHDLADAGWVAQRLSTPSRSGDGFHVGDMIPSGFESYARIFHPLYEDADGARNEGTRWADVARAHGRVIHDQMQWQTIAVDAGRSEDIQVPAETGNLDRALIETVAQRLRGFTATPERCIFAIWNGFGLLDAEEPALLVSGKHRNLQRKPRRYEFDPYLWLLRRLAPNRYEEVRWKPSLSVFGDAPLLALPGREYFVLTGKLEALSNFVFHDIYQSPNIWWPEDRAWCVATEIDFSWTYIGGSRACIDAIISDSRLEALETTLDARGDFQGDSINI